MVVNQPHYLLFCDTHLSSPQACALESRGFGRWHFVLEQLDGPERIEAADSESEVHRDRLALLAVVRGLEALEQPSQVTLITTSRYVSRGLRYGLNEWREADYTWEHFGMQKPIRNADLWQRIDCAMRYHQVTCRLLQSPLAQAVVETAAELDEISCLSQTQGSEVCSAQLAAAVMAPKLAAAEQLSPRQQSLPGGALRRVDPPHVSGLAFSKRPSPARAKALAHSHCERSDAARSLAIEGEASAFVPCSQDAWREEQDNLNSVPAGGIDLAAEAQPSDCPQLGHTYTDGSHGDDFHGDDSQIVCQPNDWGTTDTAVLPTRRWTIRIPIPTLRGLWWLVGVKWWSLLRSKFAGRNPSPMMAPT